ncbi:MAG: peptidoglycan DD-metalloendopeptidase family protein [Aquificae bacterium]|nr:peptidoglycan DD-metalloendopeptidase family protein [Aquificota bacterium]
MLGLLRRFDHRRLLTEVVEPIAKAYSGILFLPSLRLGLALLLLTFLDLNVGLSGAVAIISAYLFAKFLGLSKTFTSLDYYIYNPLLVGLGIGFLFKLSPLTLSLIVVLSILTFLVTYTLSNVMGYYLGLPVLSIPFVLVSIVAYLAAYKYSNLFVYYLYPHRPGWEWLWDLPQWLQGFFSSLGAVFFYPQPLVGLLVFLLLLRFSPIAAFLAATGYAAGTLFLLQMGLTPEEVFGDPSAFNFVLTAVALGGVFLVPHPKSYLLALAGVLTAVPVVEAAKVFFQYYGLPIFALPFNAVVLLFVYTLSVLGFRYRNWLYLGSPERSLDHFLAYSRRFPLVGREVGLPFSGRWTVWQGFDGEWTHKGPWRHALDFVITDEEGKTYRGSGYYLTDYYAYRKPVLSPVSGTVVEVVDGFPDNPPGQADKENNWGNYVLIYDWRGFYVLLAHFAQNSIKVKKGDRVERGTLLGLCGNSGYSPQPHIHMHVQLTPKVGAPTVPFVIDAYVREGLELRDYSVPKKGERVEAFYPDKVLREKFNLLIEDRFDFVLEKEGERKRVSLRVEMAPDGSFYLTDGKGKLYFGQKFGIFYCYRLEGEGEVLSLLFRALSKVPLNFSKPLEWEDHLPLEVAVSPAAKTLALFLTSFYHDLFRVKVRARATGPLSFKFEGRGWKAAFGGGVKISPKGRFVEEVLVEEGERKVVLKRA